MTWFRPPRTSWLWATSWLLFSGFACTKAPTGVVVQPDVARASTPNTALAATHGAADSSARVTGQGGEDVTSSLPTLTLAQLIDGKPTAIADLKGQVLLLDVWASWCQPCRDELPVLNQLAAKFEGKVRILAVSVDEDVEAARAFLSLEPTWHLTFLHDPQSQLPSVLHASEMPSSFVFDAHGQLRFTNAGYRAGDAQRFERQIQELLTP